MTYATRECHDCGRLSGRDTMQRHTSRRKTGQTFSIDADTGARRMSSEHYSSRELLVCAECGNRRTTISNIQTGVVLLIIVVVVALIAINTSRTNDEGQYAPVAEVADQPVYVDEPTNTIEAPPPAELPVETAQPFPAPSQPVPSEFEASETTVAVPSEPSTQPAADDLTGLY